jgi:hypothetical protein
MVIEKFAAAFQNSLTTKNYFALTMMSAQNSSREERVKQFWI